MIFGNKADLMLKYQKAKAKLVEYNVSKQEYPHFTLNSNELSYPTTYVLSRYSECIIENKQDELLELQMHLKSTAEYYDAAFKAKDRQDYDLDFLLSGASAYFLNKNFGSAKVLSKKAYELISNEQIPQRLLLNIFNYLLDGVYLPYLRGKSIYVKLNNLFLDYFEKGKALKELKLNLYTYRKEVYKEENPDNIFYVDILFAVILKACENSAWKLLPQYSESESKDWISYLKKKSSIKMLWPAQRLIAEKGLLQGKNAIVQLPTGVGKTKSIELIIRAAFLSERANIAIIVAPLRALCNEISMDMYYAFEDDVTINQFSDVLQNDIKNLCLDNTRKQILICTPEKLTYLLHHDPYFFSYIDMFIFDEGHMFDDGGRGATYELLVTHIRQNITSEQQLILLSAVLPNSEKIRQWLFDENGVLATDERIVSTPKTIGFSSVQKDIHFFSDRKDEEDYYIPRIIQRTKLNRLPRERKDRFFPDLSSTVDIAIYNAVKLCPNGGVAIYIGQQRSMKTVFNKILDLNKREYDLSPIKTNVNNDEMMKIKAFIEKYYGADHYYTKVAELGIFPHSSNIQNGIKLSVEYALKKKHISCVVCTSTLAQGVNIPIKYLLVTSIRNGAEMVKTRDFQNLVGRTARAGIYTEGSIILTDSKIYDNRNNRSNGGNYLWDDCIKLLDTRFSEECSSSILSLVQDFEIDYENVAYGDYFVKKLIEHFGEKDFLLDYARKLEEEYLEMYPRRTKNPILKEILLRREILSHIENYLCLIYSSNVIDSNNMEGALDICENTLAYALASKNEKELLKKVFMKVEDNIKNYSVEQLKRYSNAMSGIELSFKIEQWIIDLELIDKVFSEKELLRVIIDFYEESNTKFKYQSQFDDICQLWIKGKTPAEINSELNIDTSEIDTICNKNISYELNFLIGNICDLINIDEEDEYQVDPRNMLTLLQKKVKYGVPSLTAISICEKIFNDRLLAMKIAKIIGSENVGIDKILDYVKNCSDDIIDILEDYPGYFLDKINLLLR